MAILTPSIESFVFKPSSKGFLLDAYVYEEYGGIEGEDPDTGEVFRIQPGKNIYYSQARDKQNIFLSSINDALLHKLKEQCYKSKHCKETEWQKDSDFEAGEGWKDETDK